MTPVLLRAVRWSALLALTGAGAATGAGAIAMAPSGQALPTLEVALALLGGATACALDEPSAAVVAACPVRRSRQLVARLVGCAVPLLTGALLVLAWWARTSGAGVLLLELAGWCALGVGLAVLARTRLDEPAELVAPGLVLLAVTLVIVEPIGRRLTLLLSSASVDRTTTTWWVVLGTCAVAVLLAVRERRWR